MDDFDCWYDDLKRLARKHGVSVADEDAWREEFEACKSVEDALYEEYPEFRDDS